MADRLPETINRPICLGLWGSWFGYRQFGRGSMASLDRAGGGGRHDRRLLRRKAPLQLLNLPPHQAEAGIEAFGLGQYRLAGCTPRRPQNAPRPDLKNRKYQNRHDQELPIAEPVINLGYSDGEHMEEDKLRPRGQRSRQFSERLHSVPNWPQLLTGLFRRLTTAKLSRYPCRQHQTHGIIQPPDTSGIAGNEPFPMPALAKPIPLVSVIPPAEINLCDVILVDRPRNHPVGQ
ncbi:MAG: hypothetical protein J0I02_12320, partial [Alphaproteobacteria bacterium]|nr:hypothetical protein [Alphaproteobacteria bacterium]